MKRSRIEVGMTCDVAFHKLKEAILFEPVLRFLNFEKLFEEHIDAVDRAVGGNLVQDGHPIAFDNWMLKPTE